MTGWPGSLSKSTSGSTSNAPGRGWRTTRGGALQREGRRKGHEETASGSGNGAPAPAILMVEDNDADADLLVALLAAEYPASSFTRVTRLKEAMERAHEASYEIILTDLTLPDARGFDAITRLQAAAPNTAIVVVSGLSDDSLAQQVGELGAQVKVIRNDAITVPEIERMAPERLVISPGPGRPESAGVTGEALRRFVGHLPVLGVCVGHEGRGGACGGRVVGE